MKRLRAIIALAMVMLLCACSIQTQYNEDLPLSTAMPPEPAANQDAPFEAALYFIAADGRNLAVEYRTVEREEGTSYAYSALQELMKGPQSTALTPSIPEGLMLDAVELSTDACNVYFTGTFPAIIQQWLVARIAVAATVKAAEGIGSVNVYFNQMEPGYAGRPLGALLPVQDALDVYLNNLRQEYEVLSQTPEGEAGSYETRLATLYFADSNVEWLLCSNREVYYSRSERMGAIAKTLVDELLKGATGDSELEPVLPAELTLAQMPRIYYPDTGEYDDQAAAAGNDTNEPVLSQFTTGIFQAGAGIENRECIIELVFNELEQEYNEDIMCGALVLTLTGFIPNVKGVKISFVKEDGTLDTLGNGAYFKRSDFTHLIGHTIKLAFPESDGLALNSVARVVGQSKVYDPYARLCELFEGPADPGVLYPLFICDDIESVYAADDLIVINWRAGFSEKLKNMVNSEAFAVPKSCRERLFIFSVVNTLTELPGINRVWMLEDGKKLNTPVSLYLGNPLLRNPGLIIAE